MKRIQIRLAHLLLYIAVLGYFFYPTGSSPFEGEGLRWTLTFCGAGLVLAVLYLILRYRERRRSQYDYGYYPKDKGEDKKEDKERHH